MGNNTSQAFSDGEEDPQYRYHEAVLQEAQSRVASPQQAGAGECLSDDEQFYSADEGESSRSVTPVRTRPESSSGEEQVSDNEDAEEEEEDMAVGERSPVLSPPMSSNVLRRNLRGTRSCGQCSVSAFQEHDSIGPELADSVVGRESSSVQRGSRAVQTRQGLSVSVDASPPKKSRVNTSPSPFQPICSPVKRLRLSSKLVESVSPSKRKLKRSEDDEVAVSPAKQALVRGSSKRKRFGLPDSSDSEGDKRGEEEEQEASHRAARGNSKRKKLSRSVKKQRRPDRRSSGSETDEERYRKTRREPRSSDSEEEVYSSEERCSKQRKHQQRSSTDGYSKKSKRSRDDHSDSDNSRRGSGRSKKHSRSRRFSDSGSEDEEDGSTHSRKDPRKNGGQKVSPQKHNRQNVAPLTQTNGFVNRNSVVSGSSTGWPTQKMGDHGIRNALGKVLPRRQSAFPSPPELATTTSQASQESPTKVEPDPTLTDVSNIARRLRPTSGAFMALQASPARSRLVWAAQQQSRDGGDNPPGRDDVPGKEQLPAGLSISASGDDTVSPFRSLVLIPPSLSSCPPEATKYSQLERNGDSGVPIAMEVDNSNHHKDSPATSPTGNQSPRPVAKARRHSQGKTAAERFRNFWSAKKNIGSNLKSFFLRRNSSSSSYPSKAANKNSNEIGGTETLGTTHGGCDSSVSDVLSPSSMALSFISSDGRVGTPLHQDHTERSTSGQESPTAQCLSGSKGQPGTRSPAGTAWKLRPVPICPGGVSPSQAGYQGKTRKSPRQRPGRSPQAALPLVEHLPQTSQYQVLHARLCGQLTLSVSLGELADAPASGLVNWTDGDLTHTVTPCSKAVALRAGALLRAGCSDYIENKGGPLEAPDVLTTPAGGRFHPSVEAVLHVVSPSGTSALLSGRQQHQNKAVQQRDDPTSLLLQVYINCLRFAEEKLGLDSLAFPLIGTDQFTLATCIQCFHHALLTFLHEQGPSTSLTGVQLVIPDAVTTDFTADHLQACLVELSSCGDLSTAVTGLGGHCWAAGVNQGLEFGQGSPSHDGGRDVVDGGRAMSGRPRLKRPRL